MKVCLPDYEYKEPFDAEDCKECAYSRKIGEEVCCTTDKMIHYIRHNLKCGAREQRTQGEIDMEQI